MAEQLDGTWVGVISARDGSDREHGGELRLELRGDEATAAVRGHPFMIDRMIRTGHGIAMRIYKPNDIEGIVGYDLYGTLQVAGLAGEARVWICSCCVVPVGEITIADGTWQVTRAE